MPPNQDQEPAADPIHPPSQPVVTPQQPSTQPSSGLSGGGMKVIQPTGNVTAPESTQAPQVVVGGQPQAQDLQPTLQQNISGQTAIPAAPPILSYNESTPPSSKKWLTFNKIISVAFIVFVVLPIILALMAGTNGSWGTVGIIYEAIFNLMVIVTIWAIHKWWTHGKQKENMLNDSFSSENAFGEVSQPSDRSSFFIKVGSILFVLSALGVLSAFVTNKNMTVASGYPIYYAIFIYFISPVSVLIGIGMAIWAVVQIRKSRRRVLIVVAIILSLSPIWSLLIGRSIINSPIAQSPTVKTLNQPAVAELKTFNFTFYLPPSSSGFTSHYYHDYLPQDAATIQNLKVADFRITDDKAGHTVGSNMVYIFDLYMFTPDASQSITRGSTSCYNPNPIPCTYGFTTPNGTIVLTHSEPSNGDSYSSTITDYFRKSNTYLYLSYDQSNSTPDLTNWGKFIDSLQPTSLQNVEKNL